jgi:chromosome partitioning protein
MAAYSPPAPTPKPLGVIASMIKDGAKWTVRDAVEELSRRRERGKLPHRTVVTLNEKGGVAKTTTTEAVAGVYAAAGYRVRMVCADPQEGSLTGWFPPKGAEMLRTRNGASYAKVSLQNVLMEAVPMADATYETGTENLYIVPSYQNLKQFEAANEPDINLYLKMAIEEDAEQWDYTIVDCPPALGQITINALAAADEVVIAAYPGMLDLTGVAALGKTLEATRRALNPNFDVAGIAFRNPSEYSQLYDAIAGQLRADYPDSVFGVFRTSVRAGEAPDSHQPLTTYAPSSTTAQDYAAFSVALDDRRRRTSAA